MSANGAESRIAEFGAGYLDETYRVPGERLTAHAPVRATQASPALPAMSIAVKISLSPYFRSNSQPDPRRIPRQR
jgi:hypothetical protein